MVAQDEAFAFGSEGGGQAGAFGGGEDDAVEILVVGLAFFSLSLFN